MPTDFSSARAAGSPWNDALRTQLAESILPGYLPLCRWFGGKGRRIEAVTILHELPLDPARLFVIAAAFAEGSPERYVLPLLLAEAPPDEAAPQAVLARFDDGTALCDAVYSPAFRAALLREIARGDAGGATVRLTGVTSRGASLAAVERLAGNSRVVGAEQSNTAVIYGDEWFLKIFRKFEPGPNPDLDVTRFLSEARGFAHVPPFVGALRLADPAGDAVLALVSGFTPNRGDGWVYSLGEVGAYFERVLATVVPPDLATAGELAGIAYLDRARQLGRRTGEMHAALASGVDFPDFAPEPFTPESQRELHDTIAAATHRLLRDLRERIPDLPEAARAVAAEVVSGEARFATTFGALVSHRIAALRLRIHGDYHLGQVLDTGTDFVILDFEGEPRRTLLERLAKRSPLVDVAGMLRSFDYAGSAALRARPAADFARLEPWAHAWVAAAQQAFLDGYFAVVSGAAFLPPDRADVDLLLRVFTLEKALYEIGYELSYRPDFLPIPLGAVQRLLAESPRD